MNKIGGRGKLRKNTEEKKEKEKVTSPNNSLVNLFFSVINIIFG